MTRVRTTLVFLFLALAVAATAQITQKEKPAAKAPAKHAPGSSGDSTT